MRHSFRERGGGWVIAQSALMLAVIGLGVVCHGEWRARGWTWAGAALFVVGGTLGIAGVAVLGSNRTPYPRPQPQSELITRGVYARIRHPLYTSVMLVALGWALLWQSWPSLVVAVVLGPFFDAKARHEERWLCAQFPDYPDYQRRTRRFVPWIY